ncbi:MAG: nucleotidyltransferase domain-containing protein [Candidatus Hatepunaea meridiana]|nr:nucleotidyltransferase domain-containing protein [Candidatus Hatepunaea meridiana]
MDPQLAEIVKKITAYINPVKIFLFGSRARGDARLDSDYDLAIIYDGDKSKGDVELDIYRLFMSSMLSLDVFILTSEELERFKPIATTLAREITENGVVVFG